MAAMKEFLGAYVADGTTAKVDAYARRRGWTRSKAIRELIERSLRRLRMPADEGRAS